MIGALLVLFFGGVCLGMVAAGAFVVGWAVYQGVKKLRP